MPWDFWRPSSFRGPSAPAGKRSHTSHIYNDPAPAFLRVFPKFFQKFFAPSPLRGRTSPATEAPDPQTMKIFQKFFFLPPDLAPHPQNLSCWTGHRKSAHQRPGAGRPYGPGALRPGRHPGSCRERVADGRTHRILSLLGKAQPLPDSEEAPNIFLRMESTGICVTGGNPTSLPEDVILRTWPKHIRIREENRKLPPPSSLYAGMRRPALPGGGHGPPFFPPLRHSFTFLRFPAASRKP